MSSLVEGGQRPDEVHQNQTNMKLSIISLLCIAAHAQTIRRVNNNAGVTGVNVYTTAQAAHDAAAANDILMIEPSVTTYENLILTKPLKIYGNGYFLSTIIVNPVNDATTISQELKDRYGFDVELVENPTQDEMC